MIAAIVLAALGSLALRVVVEGRDALADGDAALAAKRPAEAIAAWESAARWYLPGASHVDEAYTRLTQLAAAEPRHALAAWRAVRAAARSTRWLSTPHADDLASADAAIAKLAADDPEASIAGGVDRAARLAWHAQQLERDPRPRGGPLALAVFGIVAWLVGLGAFVRRGLDSAGTLVRRPALASAALTVSGIVAWAAGLYSA